MINVEHVRFLNGGEKIEQNLKMINENRNTTERERDVGTKKCEWCGNIKKVSTGLCEKCGRFPSIKNYKDEIKNDIK